jgi:hypothetical protein
MLPANPLGDVSEETIDYFVELTVREDAMTEAENVQALAPARLPNLDETSRSDAQISRPLVPIELGDDLLPPPQKDDTIVDRFKAGQFAKNTPETSVTEPDIAKQPAPVGDMAAPYPLVPQPTLDDLAESQLTARRAPAPSFEPRLFRSIMGQSFSDRGSITDASVTTPARVESRSTERRPRHRQLAIALVVACIGFTSLGVCLMDAYRLWSRPPMTAAREQVDVVAPAAHGATAMPSPAPLQETPLPHAASAIASSPSPAVTVDVSTLPSVGGDEREGARPAATRAGKAVPPPARGKEGPSTAPAARPRARPAPVARPQPARAPRRGPEGVDILGY